MGLCARNAEHRSQQASSGHAPGRFPRRMAYTPLLPNSTTLLGAQGHDNQEPPFGTVHELDGTPVRARYPVDHGQSESRTGLAAGNILARERFDQRIGTDSSNAGAPILDGHNNV